MLSNYLPALLASIAILAGADKKDDGFRPPPATSYPNKQTINGVVLAADPYLTASQSKTAFGKTHPYEHGVMPVLLLLKNESQDVIDLKRMSVAYTTSSRQKLEAVPANEVRFLRPPDRPRPSANPLPRIRKPKNPLEAFEIESRAFAAKMLLPGESAHGFIYFNTDHRSGALLYITGMHNVTKKEEMFFVEIPLP
jgi:hypothetical protein